MDVTRAAVLGRSAHWDDLTGEPPNQGDVQKARRLEVEYFRQMGVYRTVPVSEAREGVAVYLGRVVWMARDGWNSQARLVTKYVETNDAPELLAATPPIESLILAATSGARFGAQHYAC